MARPREREGRRDYNAAMTTTCLALLCAVTLAAPLRAQSDASGSRDLNDTTRSGPITASIAVTRVGDGVAGTTTDARGEVLIDGIQQDSPADVAGAWALTVETGQGTGTPSVTLKQDGEKLTGTYSSQVFGEQQITGTIKRNAVTFSFTGSVEGNTLTVTYSGTVEKDSMKGKVALGDLGEGTFTGRKKQAP